MNRRLRQIVTTWPFVLALATLLANDLWLKGAWPGMLSGKLSDFAGVAVVSLLLLAALPGRRWLAAGLVVVGFSWWKSPLSQPAIDAINAFLPVAIGRTVDFTDLSAFLGIPACAVVAARPGDFALPGKTLRRVLAVPTIALTLFALMATSTMPYRPQDFRVHRIDGAPELDRDAVARTIAQVAELNGLACRDCTNASVRGQFGRPGLFLDYEFVGGRSISFEVSAASDGPFFGKSGAEKADHLRDELKRRLAADFKDLEYVEPLGERARRPPFGAAASGASSASR